MTVKMEPVSGIAFKLSLVIALSPGLPPRDSWEITSSSCVLSFALHSSASVKDSLGGVNIVGLMNHLGLEWIKSW